MRTQSFTDFSGGITDKIIPGTHNRYLAADNLLIDADQKLFIRNGFAILSSTAYQLTTANERVARLVNFNADSEIIAVQNKKAQYVNAGAWANLSGPTSNNAFNTNTTASLIEEAQWANHLFLASDSGDPVVKLFKDGSTWKLRTAGLPKPAVTSTYSTDAAKLSAAITLATAIKTAMQAHFNNYGIAPAAHVAKDVTNYDSLNALSAPTTLADLITYTNTLRTAYSLHVLDARSLASFQVYHIGQSNLTPPSAFGYIKNPILNVDLETSIPTSGNMDTIDEVIRVLNEIRNKYNWHVDAPITHNNATQTSPSWGGNRVSATAINIDAVTPLIDPTNANNSSTLINYVNRLKAEWNIHLAADASSGSEEKSWFAHKIADTDNIVRMADAGDLHTAVGLLANIAYSYSQHVEKANRKSTSGAPYGFYTATEQMYFIFKGDVTSGSDTITNVTPDPTSALILPAGYFIAKMTDDTTSPYTGWYSPNAFAVARTVVSKTATTIKMSGNSSVTATNKVFAFHWDGAHLDVDRNSESQLNSATCANLFYSLWDPLLPDVTAACLLASTFATKIKAHTLTGLSALTAAELYSGLYFNSTVIQEVDPDFTYYKATDFASTTEYAQPHSSLNLAVWPHSSVFSDGTANEGQGYFEAGLTTKSYLYRLVYKHSYTVGTTEFVDLSATSDVIEYLTAESPVNPYSGDTTWLNGIYFTGIPVLANASNQNYDTSNIKVQIYRTIGDGSVYYKVGEITNGTTTYTDTTDDTTLLNNEALYTNGGVVDNDAPPVAAHITTLENRMYYATANKVYQSLESDPDSVPANFFDTFEENITGISSTRSNVVVFTALNVYRLEGQFDELGQGFLRHERIFDRTGCISAGSIVKADNNIFFAGIDGFYCTDGYQCFRVTDFEDTFSSVYTASAGKKAAIQGAYDNIHKKVFWTIKTDDAYTAADKIIVLDLQFGIKKDITPTTTFSGGFDGYTGFRPTALMFYQNKLHYGDDLGYVYSQNASLYLDVRRDAAVAATSWEKRTILWDYKSCHEDFGSPNFRKYFTRVNVEFEQNTNLSVQIKSDADKGRIISSLPVIRSRKLLDWGDSKIDWTSSVYTAKDGGVIDEFRRFKADGSLRSNYRAIEMQNAYCVVVASNIMGVANVANISANTWSVTLVNTPTYKWPLYSVGYYIRINGVDYPVTVRTSDSVVRVSDAGLTALTAQTGIAWEMWGYPKNEQGKLLNYDVNFEILGQQQKSYLGTTSTDGGQNS